MATVRWCLHKWLPVMFCFSNKKKLHYLSQLFCLRSFHTTQLAIRNSYLVHRSQCTIDNHRRRSAISYLLQRLLINEGRRSPVVSLLKYVIDKGNHLFSFSTERSKCDTVLRLYWPSLKSCASVFLGGKARQVPYIFFVFLITYIWCDGQSPCFLISFE